VKQLALFDIPIPSNSEQQRIATYLDKTCAAIDKTIGVKQKQLEILDALRKSIIHKAVTSGLDDSVELKDSGVEWLGRIPKHWDVVKLKYEVEVKDGTHDTPPYALDAESNYPFVTSKDIIDNKIDFSATKYISKKYHQSFNRRSDVKKGDIIMPMIGTLGNAAIVKTDKSFSIKNVALFKTSKSSRINTKYLFYFIESEINKRQFFLLSKGGVQSFLSLTILRNLYLIKPHLKEQKKIATWLDNINKQINDLKKNIQQQISTLEQYRKSLIHECVTGKRRSAG
jgi:type I restriction enzyme S subunit